MGGLRKFKRNLDKNRVSAALQRKLFIDAIQEKISSNKDFSILAQLLDTISEKDKNKLIEKYNKKVIDGNVKFAYHVCNNGKFLTGHSMFCNSCAGKVETIYYSQEEIQKLI